MKGVVFTEFLELVEGKFGLDVVDRIIGQADLPTGGAYTSVGTYDHHELLRLVTQLQQATGAPVSTLVRTFGRHLLHRLASSFPQFFAGVRSLDDFLPTVESVIHVEVRKLYPDAELPTLAFQAIEPGRFDIEYRSTRPFVDLAVGLLEGSAEHFGERIEIEREDLPGPAGTAARFHVTCLRKADPCLTTTC